MTLSQKHPIQDSMWSSDVCNALNSGMKLAVLLQTSNTLIIDDSLWGAAALYHTANKTRNKWEKEGRTIEQRGRALLHFCSSEQKKENKKAFKQWKQSKVVKSWHPGVTRLYLPLMQSVKAIENNLERRTPNTTVSLTHDWSTGQGEMCSRSWREWSKIVTSSPREM